MPFSLSRFSKRYLFASVLTGGFILTALISLYQMFYAQANYAAIINLSGAQRMLSQRITLYAVDLTDLESQGDKTAYQRTQDELWQLILQMEKAHNALLFGDKSLGLPHHRPSMRLRRLYYSSPWLLDQQVKNFLSHAKHYATQPFGQLAQHHTDLQMIRKAATGPLLTTLDKAVDAYQQESQDRIIYLVYLNTVILILIIFVMLLKVKFIFHPILKRISRESQKLRDKTEDLLFHINNTPLAVVQLDCKLKILAWSPQAKKLFGWHFGEVFGKNILEWPFFYEIDGHIADDNFQLLLQDKLSRNVHLYRNYTKTGKLLTCEWHSSVRFNTQGQPLTVLSFIQDVSEHEKLQEDLKINEQRFQIMFDRAPLGVGLLDRENKILTSNPAFRKIFNYTLEEVQNLNILELIDVSDQPRYRYYQQQLEKEEIETFQLESHHAIRQQTFWIKFSFSLIYDVFHTPKYMLCMLENITEKKQIELYLQEAHRNFAYHIENSPLAVVEWGGDFRVTRWSKQAEKIFGWQETEALGKHYSELHLLSEEDLVEISKVLTQLVESQTTHYFCLKKVYTKSGEVRQCEWHNSLSFSEGKIISILSFIQDVTERQRIQDKLETSETIIKKIAENSGDVLYIHDAQQRKLIYASPAYERIWGRSRQALYENPLQWLQAIHPEEQTRVSKSFQGFYSHGYFEEEYRILRPDSTQRWIRDHSSPVYHNGQLYQVVGIAADVSHYKETEINLRRIQLELEWRNNELNKLYEFSRQIGFLYNFKSVARLLYAHLYSVLPQLDVCCLILADNLWGPPAIITRRTLQQELLNSIKKDVLTISREFNQSWQEEEIQIIDLVEESDTPITSFEAVLDIPLFKTNHPVGKLDGVFRITSHQQERFETEELRTCYTLLNHFVNALKRIHDFIVHEQRNLEQAVAYLPFGILLINKEERIVWANEQALKFLPHITPSKVGEVLAGIAYTVIAPLLTGEVKEFRNQKLFLEDYVLELMGTTLTVGPYTGHYIITIQDITEHHQVDMLLQEERSLLTQRVQERTEALSTVNLQLLKANRLKDEFLANMSHELRTPLNAILGVSEALSEKVYGDLNDRQLKSIKSIYDSGQHLLALINDILDLSKIEADKVELQYDNCDVKRLCQESLTLIREQAQKKNIKLQLQLEMELDILWADPRRLKQILVNLLSNAVKFTPEKGKITLETQQDLDNKVVHFILTDTGVGISVEEREHLFKPFVQLDSGLNRQHEGTGLGLALVQRLTELHGGSVSLESEKGKGTQFIISLPLVATEIPAPEEKMTSPSTTTASNAEGKPLILLAEDNLTNIDTFSEYLRAKGYRVNIACTGLEVLERLELEEELPSLILMDIQMPGMDGLEATKRIRAQERTAHIPIIALTALTMPGDRERCLAQGLDDYLSKPVNMRTLVQTIETYLSSTNKAQDAN